MQGSMFCFIGIIACLDKMGGHLSEVDLLSITNYILILIYYHKMGKTSI